MNSRIHRRDSRYPPAVSPASYHGIVPLPGPFPIRRLSPRLYFLKNNNTYFFCEFLFFDVNSSEPEFIIEVFHGESQRRIIVPHFLCITTDPQTLPKLGMKTQIKLKIHAIVGSVIYGKLLC